MKRLLIVFSLLMPVHPSDAQTSSGADAANRHAFELFQLFRQMTPGNFCFSPYSGHRIAALLVEGARGETKKQFLGLTHLPEDAAERARLAEGLRKELAEKSQGLLLDVASSLWVPAEHPSSRTSLRRPANIRVRWWIAFHPQIRLHLLPA